MFLNKDKHKPKKKANRYSGKFQKYLGSPQVGLPPIKYHQGDKAYCLYYSFANVLHYVGLKGIAKMVADAAPKYSVLACHKAINKLYEIMQTHAPYLEGHKYAAGELDPLTNQSKYPTLLVLENSHGSISHCVATVSNLLFDSNLAGARSVHARMTANGRSRRIAGLEQLLI